MSINKHKPHLLVLPEDDADRQIANGFVIAQGVGLDDRAIQILPEAGGWKKVLDEFIECHCSEMRSHPARMMVLLIDFDNQYKTRFPYFKNNIPVDLQCRVFVLGVWSEPEQLKRALGCVGFETIGEALAMDCYENTTQTWGHFFSSQIPELIFSLFWPSIFFKSLMALLRIYIFMFQILIKENGFFISCGSQQFQIVGIFF